MVFVLITLQTTLRCTGSPTPSSCTFNFRALLLLTTNYCHIYKSISACTLLCCCFQLYCRFCKRSSVYSRIKPVTKRRTESDRTSGGFTRTFAKICLESQLSSVNLKFRLHYLLPLMSRDVCLAHFTYLLILRVLTLMVVRISVLVVWKIKLFSW